MYVRSSDFDTANPEQLRRDLQQMDRAVEAAVSSIGLPLLDAKVRKVSSATAANFGELLVVDTSSASVVVTLPQTAANKASSSGRAIGILRSSLVNTLTIQCVGSDEINAASTYTVSASYGLFVVVFDGSAYWVR